MPLSIHAPAHDIAARCHRFGAAFVIASAALLLVACGGGSGVPEHAAEAAAAPTAAQAAEPRVQPAYHLAPVLPGEPDDVDRDGSSASARMAPRTVGIPLARRNLDTRALTYQDLADDTARLRALAGSEDAVSPQAASSTVTYTPAQVRAAYGLPPVPSDLSSLTPLQSAQLGAGQTIYVIAAFHDPYAYGELLAFSGRFGLPGCTQKTLAATATLPLAAPSTATTTCDFYQVASGEAGSIADTAPRYDAQWATEIAMDVQWAHAIAPLARIVLIEGASDSLADIANAIQLAGRMGPGVVSMSFATPEGSFVADRESLFQVAGMSHFAATGDNGAAVNWPALSPAVVAVGGTSLRYSGSSTRSESAWSLAGGGVSTLVSTPAYQQNATLLRTAAVVRRSVADVSMNADPNTGQFVAVIPNPLTCTFCQVSWVTAGGTSLSTPQWAGLAAVANALRARAGKATLGAPHAALYQVLSSASSYASAFLDIASGSNGKCATCTAKVGYDGPTGLGTPNGLALVNLLAESNPAPSAPVVVPYTVRGDYGQAISFTPSVSSANAYSLSISAGPTGMLASGSVVNWLSPVTGTYTVKVTAKDLKSGLSGSAVYTVIVAPPPAPIVGGGSVTGTVGKALSFAVSVGDRYPCKLSLAGAPSGMSISASGTNGALIAWAKPVAGTYRFTLKADNAQTKLSGQAGYTLVVNPAGAPLVASGQLAGRAGTPFSATVGVSSANATTLSLAGAPAGMAISAAGVLTWAAPVAGSYAVTVNASDSRTGVVGSGVLDLSFGDSTGPAVFSSVMSGVAGKPFSGTITVTDGGASLAGLAIAGSHAGIRFDTALGMATTAVSWAAPVTGNYTVQVSVADSAGRRTMASIPLVINAK